MTLELLLAVLAPGLAAPQAGPPVCQAQAGRRAELVRGVARRGEPFVATAGSDWILRLVPDSEGWWLRVTRTGRESEDLARLTPPWHGVPNPRDIKGWHFRNADNTGPNDGSVNAPQALREFIFSPSVRREVEYAGSATTVEDVDRVRSFGRGWLLIESYQLTPPWHGERAAFETMTFSACLTWPASQSVRGGKP